MSWFDWYSPWPALFCRDFVAPTLRCFARDDDTHFCAAGCALAPPLWAGVTIAQVPLGGRMVLRSQEETVFDPSEFSLKQVGSSRDALNNRRSWFPNELKRFVVDKLTNYDMAPLRCENDSRPRSRFGDECGRASEYPFLPISPVYSCGFSIENGQGRAWELTCQFIGTGVRPLPMALAPGGGYQAVLAGHGDGFVKLADQFLWGFNWDCDGTRMHPKSDRVQMWNSLDILSRGSEWNGQIVPTGTPVEREQIRMQNMAIARVFATEPPVPGGAIGGMLFDRVDRNVNLMQIYNHFFRSWDYNNQPTGDDYTARDLISVTSLTGALRNTGVELEADLVILHPQVDVYLSFLGSAENLDLYLDIDYAKLRQEDDDGGIGPSVPPTDAQPYPIGTFNPDLRALIQILVNVRLGVRCRIPEGSEWMNPITGETGVVTFVHTDSFGYALGDLSVQWTVGEDIHPVPSEGPAFEFNGKPFVPPTNATIEFEMGPTSRPQWHNLWHTGTYSDDFLMEKFDTAQGYTCMIAHAMRHNVGVDLGLAVGAKQTIHPTPKNWIDEHRAPGLYRGQLRLAPTAEVHVRCSLV